MRFESFGIQELSYKIGITIATEETVAKIEATLPGFCALVLQN